MEEECYKTKTEVVTNYIFSSIMIISIIFILGASAILFSPELIADENIRFGTTLGFIAFLFIMASMLGVSVRGLLEAAEDLIEGDYE